MKPMFKARLRETLEAFLVAYDDGPTSAEEVIEQTLSEIIELVKEIVPEPLSRNNISDHGRVSGHNSCRQAILTNLGGDR